MDAVKLHALANSTKSPDLWKGLGNPHIHFNTCHLDASVGLIWVNIGQPRGSADISKNHILMFQNHATTKINKVMGYS